MGFFKNLLTNITTTKRVSTVQMVQERGNGFYSYNGKMYQSDIVRACIRPKIKAIGKLTAKHIRETITAQTRKIAVNPEPYIRFLLEEPNQYMTGQLLQEKLAAQLVLNNNAFAVILRDENGLPNAIFPVAAMQADAVYDAGGNLYLKFYMQNGNVLTFAYDDIIHLRGDFYENDIFGDPIAPAIVPLMEIVTTTDQGIVKAIRNSAVIRWLFDVRILHARGGYQEARAGLCRQLPQCFQRNGRRGRRRKGRGQADRPQGLRPERRTDG